MTDMTTKGPRPSDKWIPWYFALFFGVMVAVLLPMTYIAVKTMPGTVTEHSYEKGLAYNKILATAAQEQKLGWSNDLTVAATPGTAEAKVAYALRDADNKPIDDAVVRVHFVRPAQGGMDRDVILTPAGQGRYEGDIALPAGGVWDARVSATRGEQNFQDGKRIVID